MYVSRMNGGRAYPAQVTMSDTFVVHVLDAIRYLLQL